MIQLVHDLSDAVARRAETAEIHAFDRVMEFGGRTVDLVEIVERGRQAFDEASEPAHALAGRVEDFPERRAASAHQVAHSVLRGQ